MDRQCVTIQSNMLAALIIIIRKRIGARPSYIHLWDYTLDELRCDALR